MEKGLVPCINEMEQVRDRAQLCDGLGQNEFCVWRQTTGET
jgi:hypothetical protein